MSVARFIADQRTLYRLPVALTSPILRVSASWCHKWQDRGPTKGQQSQVKLDTAVGAELPVPRGLHRSPRIVEDLGVKGWRVSEKEVADLMRMPRLIVRIVKLRNGFTKRDKTETPASHGLTDGFGTGGSMTATSPKPARYRFSVCEEPFAYQDPYVNEHHGRVLTELRALEALAANHYGPNAGHLRKRLSSIDLSNPATAALVERYATFEHWLSQIPTAAALHPLYEPDTTHYPTGVFLDEDTRHWFRNIADAHGIRSRAEVMRCLLAKSAVETGADAMWLSLACGAAQPVVRTMEQLAAQGCPVPQTTLADLDPSALKLAKAYASDHALEDKTETVRVNVLDRRGFETVGARLPGIRRRSGWLNAFDAVDAVGILEYLKPDDWIYTYNGVITTRRKHAGAITFLRNAFACVKPGGILIVGNMLDTHPQLGFTMNVVQWPHIQPRSIETMLSIFDSAGLSGHVDVHLPSDGVYAVYAIHKV